MWISTDNPVLKEALQYENYFAKNDKLRRLYNIQEKTLRDYNSSINSAEKRGIGIGKKDDIING